MAEKEESVLHKRYTRQTIIIVDQYDDGLKDVLENLGYNYLVKHISTVSVDTIPDGISDAESDIRHPKEMVTSPGKGTPLNKIIVRKGSEYFVVRVQDIAFFLLQNGIVFLFTTDGKKYITGKSLSELNSQLDASMFFRSGRNFIINGNFIKSYSVIGNNIQVLMSVVHPETILVSKYSAHLFKKWLEKCPYFQ